MCSTDARLLDYLYEAESRLAYEGLWPHVVGRYRICTTTGSLTWPRSIETIEAFAICRTPGTIENGWYEFLGHGYGLEKQGQGSTLKLVDRGYSPIFNDITTTGKKLRVTADVAESASATILIRGYDNNSQWIRTQDPDGTWIDGERVAISTTPTNSTNTFSTISEIIKPVTNGPVRLYEWDVTAAAVTQTLGYYQADETRPWYRRSLIPGITTDCNCGPAADNGGCGDTSVTVVARLKVIKALKDEDYLRIGNLHALRLMCKALVLEDADRIEEATIYQNRAVMELDKELRAHLGTGAVPRIKVESTHVYGAGNVDFI